MEEDVRAAVHAAVDRLADDEVTFLRALVAEPSVRGHTNGCQRLIAERLGTLGLDVDEVPIDVAALRDLPGFSPPTWSYEGQHNVAARLPAAGAGGRSLILNGHVDVVPTTPEDHWTHGPWAGEVEDGRLYGRGAADMKGGIAAMIFALAAIREARAGLAGDVEVHTVIDEECSGNGTLAVLASGRRADGAIIPEPMNLRLCTAHPGVLWARIRVRGMGAHAERASSAVNAIEKMQVMIAAVRLLEAEVNRLDRRHPAFAELEHPLNYNIGTLHAGDWPSSVPEECEMEVRFSYNPGERVGDVQERIAGGLLDAARSDEWLAEFPPEITWFGFQAEPAVYDTEDELSRTLEANHLATVGR
ncbi:MAG: ArgE/DapE family deacylase, partial [Candidatus Dormibacteraeota bacterium]|nr:ArgE/DapE family deacylase [Candidatus Dormibacteraeota bacterium]